MSAAQDKADKASDVTTLKRALVDLKSRLDASVAARKEPIALVGAACRFPGAQDLDALWRLLAGGVDAIREVPPDRWDAQAFYDPRPDAPGKMVTRWGGFLEDVAGFDPHFFGISPREALAMDPQQRLLLEIAWEALEDAGMNPEALSGTPVGVFVGICSSDYTVLKLKAGGARGIDAFFSTGSAYSIAAGRISYTLGLEGPSVAVDTSCSSSLVALHLACQSLRARECDAALAGGVNLLLLPESTIAISKYHALSPDGRCKAFDSRANGFVRAEGCALVVLKRLSDAAAHGDRILAVVRGSAVNQDGRSAGLTAPNAEAQRRVLTRALASADLGAADLDCIEAHGTGTALGDPIELSALCDVFGKPRASGAPLLVGSVKTNLGHLEAAAGIAGLLKLVLALKNEIVPPHLHFRELNPRASFEGTPLAIPTEPVPWRRGARRRIAGVSSFGFSGTNAHVILEEPPLPADRAPPRDGAAHLVPISARTQAALQASAAALAARAREQGAPLADLAHTASLRRAHLSHRAAVVARSRDELAARLEAIARGEVPALAAVAEATPRASRIAFVYSGQGAHWIGMGQRLLDESAVFRDALAACDTELRSLAGMSLFDELARPEGESRVGRTDIAQPVLVAIQIALTAQWRAWGIAPSAVVGHSVGEIAAACAAGRIDVRDAMRIAVFRGRWMHAASGRGRMAAVALGWQEARRLVEPYGDRLAVAAHNGPRSAVLSGDADAVDEATAALEARGVPCRALRVDYAFHSAHMTAASAEIARALDGLSPRAGALPIWSTVTGRAAAPGDHDAAYWARGVREPVRFAPAIEALAAEGFDTFVELAPHPALRDALAECLDARPAAPDGRAPRPLVVHSLRRERDDVEEMLGQLGALHAHGVRVDFGGLAAAGGRPVSLPPYPWQRDRYWPEVSSAPDDAAAWGSAPSAHPLLGQAFTPAGDPDVRYWQVDLGAAQPAYLRDHAVDGAIVLPAAAYLEMALAAATQVMGDGPLAVEQVALKQLLALPAEGTVAVQIALTTEPGGAATFRISSARAGAWTLHAEGVVKRAEDRAARGVEPGVVRARCERALGGAEAYEALERAGLAYGPRFRRIDEVFGGDDEALARIQLDEATRDEAAVHRVHPAVLDAALQALAFARRAPVEGPYVPVAFERLRVWRRPAGPLWAHARLRKEHPGSPGVLVADLTVAGDDGVTELAAEGIRLERLGPARDALADLFFEVTWTQAARAPCERTAAAGTWLLFADEGGVSERLRRALEAQSDRCITVAAAAAYEPPSLGVARVRPGERDDIARLFAEASFREGPPCRGIVHAWSLDDEALAPGAAPSSSWPAAQRRGCDALVAIAAAATTATTAGFRELPRLWIVTRRAQPVDGEPLSLAAAPLWGLAPTLSLEHPELRCTTIDLGAGADDELTALAGELAADGDEDRVALRGGARFVARLARRAPPPEPTAVLRAGDAPVRLAIPAPGVLDRLVVLHAERRPPGPGEVEIRVETAGLNFLDVLTAMGLLPTQATLGLSPGAGLGGECAGTVAAIGAGVGGLEVGERVVAVAAPSFASYVTTPAALVAPCPAGLSAEQAASVPLVFLTARVALERVARLERGERVLVHAAAGGVGLAALQIAQRIGAEIFATAGSPEKRAFLRELGVQHVFDSRSLDFARAVRAATDGEGVDVVLNSLSGDFIAQSLDLLRDGGRFVEIGKRDYFENRKLGLRPFLRGLSFSLVDLRAMTVKQPEKVGRLLSELMQEFATGALAPLPVRSFRLRDAADAFRHMAQAKHIGKIVLQIPDPEAMVAASDLARPRFRPDATYLITGGLGGIGIELARWMVAGGARCLTLVGRSAPGADAQAAIDAIEAAGARVQVERADVAREDDVARVLARIDAGSAPLAGVLHAAGVAEDGALVDHDPARFARVMAPKVAGAWNLHAMTSGRPLDLFVLFSSIAGVLGSPTQAAYAAANAFLDALAHQRRRDGLPALSVDWGAWAEVGLAARAAGKRGGRSSAYGLAPMAPALALRALDRLLPARDASVVVASIDLRQWREVFLRAASTPFLRDLVVEGAAQAPRARGELRKELLAAPGAALRRARIEAVLSRELALVLGAEVERVDTRRALRDLGVDSLMMVELRNRIEAACGVVLPITALWSCPTVSALVPEIAGRLGVPLDGAERALPVEVTSPPSRAPRDEAPGIAPGSPDALAPGAEPLRSARVEAPRAPARPSAEPIAIVGMACRFPGGADHPDALWRLLERAVDAVREVPGDRWDMAAYARAYPDLAGIHWAGFLDRVDGFEPQVFGLSPREATSMDPQQRLVLEVAWEALEDAGLPLDRIAGTEAGVYLGACNYDYGRLASFERTPIDAYTGMGTSLNMLAGRVSYLFDLRGPSLVVDTACSSSLVAVHYACESLRSGESSVALAGGVNLILLPEGMIGMAQAHLLSPDGRCRAFDAAAAGMARGEGCGIVVLKRLRDALAGGDRVLAVIRGSAVNQDGRSNGQTAPNGAAQAALIRRALSQAGLSPADPSYIEAHGTGTPLGDPIELQALAEVLGGERADGSRCNVGSIKANLGHLEGAAGIAGLMKVVLSLVHEAIPPLVNLRHLNPRIVLDGTPLAIAREGVPWPRGARPRVAGVSSFGWSGTNAHVVLEEAPRVEPAVANDVAPAVADDVAGPHLLPVSARTAEGLAALAEAFARRVEDESVALTDLVFTAGVRRTHHAHRLAVVGRDRAELTAGLRAFASGEAHPGTFHGRCAPDACRIVFVFPGQGSQWRGMGRALYASDLAFREALDRCDAALAPWLGESAVALLTGEPPDALWKRVDVIQPLLFAMQVSLAAAWRALGVEPAAVVGHSLGEVAASCVAGALSLDDAARVICLRSQLVRRASGQGAMALVELTMPDAERLVATDPRLSLAAWNAPEAVLLAGDRGALEQALLPLQARGVFFRFVDVDYASHSPQMDPLLGEIERGLASIRPRETTLPMRSTVTGEAVRGPELDAAYWARNLRRPVLFHPVADALAASGHDVFVEVSAHPVLLPSLERGVARSRRVAVVPTLRREGDAQLGMLESLARLYTLGHGVDFARRFPGPRRPVPLPTYPWQRERYWIDGADRRAPGAIAVMGDVEAAGDALRDPLAGATYEARWVDAPTSEPAAVSSAPSSTWVVLADPGPLRDALRAAIERRGGRCVLVARGSSFAPEGADAYRVDPTSAADARSLVRELELLGKTRANVVHLWGAEADPAPSEAGHALRPAEQPAARWASALTVARAIVLAGLRDPPRIWLVTRPAPVAGEAFAPGDAPLFGLARALGSEHPELRASAVDLLPGDAASVAAALVRELFAQGDEDVVALGPGGRRVLRVERAALAPGELPFTADRCHVIAGSLGPFAAALAERLVSRGARRVVLLGEPLAPDLEAKLAALGPDLSLVRADLGDAAGVARALTEVRGSGPPLGVVVVLALPSEGDVTALHADLPHATSTFARAALGAAHVHQALVDAPVDAFVVLSRIASVVGGDRELVGAMAGSTADAVVEHRRASGLPASSIHLGPVEGFEELLSPSLGVRPLSLSQALDGIGRAVAANAACAMLARITWRHWFQAHRRALAVPALSALAREESAARGVADDSAVRKALLGAEPGDRMAIVAGFIREQLSQVLRLKPARIDEATPFAELGLDSIMALELRNRFELGLDVTLPASTMWSYPTLLPLADHVLSRMGLATEPHAHHGEVSRARDAAPAPLAPPTEDDITALTEDELALALAAELEAIQKANS